MIRRPAALAPASALKHALILRQDDAPPQRIVLTETPLRIGRGAQNDVVLASPEVSRQHCAVVLSKGAALIKDLESTNGVHVDGVCVQGIVTLVPGARLAIGPFTLRYERGSAADLAEAEAREHEQARAVSYIQALLPPPLHTGAVRAEWLFHPSAQLGGDAFGYRFLDDGRFALFLLDVSGHGVGSALLAASAANMLRAPNWGGADPSDPVSVLRGMNAAFQMDDHAGLFFSLWYGVYEAGTRRLRYASAGHHPSYLVHGAEPEPLTTRAPAIGMAPMARFNAAETEVPPGSRLYVFSDGAFEITLLDGSAGSLAGLVALFHAGAGTQPEPDRVFDIIRDMTGRRPFDDDVSLLTLVFP